MEMNKTVDDPQGSTEALSESLHRETLPTGTQVEPKEAQHVSTEAHSMSMEAQHVPTEAHHAPTEEGRLVSTEAQHMHTGAPHLFQELKTESLGTQDMPPKIEALGLMQTEEACEHLENDAKPKTGDLEIPGPSFTSTIRRESLMNKCSMISMMLDHDSDDDEEANNKELDQAALSRLCAESGEIILREEARALSELTIKTVLAEERITLEARRMSKMAIQSAYSAAVVTPLRSSKKPNIFRRLLACCFGCCRRRH
ncbi:uncharacterized protein LOC128158039 [Crassostrea angulata]|uniref:uncharacterized protein LOC128158039 n=1 Tax=Magallana angulata TaxID=2784310 RepID=UPI0022B0E568|nr:uncharacterized protein LOC128158039 [Crassostrea angulata]